MPALARSLRLVLMAVALLLVASYVAHESEWSSFVSALRELPSATYLGVLVLFILGSSLACLRLWLIASDVRSPITGVDAIRAHSVGSLAGAFFFQLLGQTVARSYVLSRAGTPTAATFAMTGYEKAVALMVSASLGAIGAWLLFGRVSFDVVHGGAELLKLLGTGIIAACGGYLGWRRYAGSCFSSRWRPAFESLSRNVVLSTAIQLCTMAAYIMVAHAFAPNTDLLRLAAASAVIMLAASLPISFAGWGIRELGAVLTLGTIGLAAEKALIVAVLVGVMSTLAWIFLAAGAYAIGTRTPRRTPPREHAVQPANIMTSMAWVLSLVVATAVFFQVHVPLNEGTRVNANLADPFAVCGGLLFLSASLRDRRWPQWWLPHINGYVIAVTLVFTAGLAIGWHSFGWTAWAFTSKYLGWFILLAYAATAALLVSTAGDAGRLAFFRTYIGAGTAIALVAIALVALKNVGVPLDEAIAPIRVSGMAGNPNAFAFQMALLLCAALVMLHSRFAVIPITIAVVAIVLSASRAGIGASVSALVLVGWLMPERRPALLQSLFLGGTILGVLFLLSIDYLDLVGILSASFGSTSGAQPSNSAEALFGQHAFLVSSFQSEVSDSERMQTIVGGWNLFLSNSMFGAGLGAFAESWRQAHGQVQVIHSTPLWLLAEFGLTGLAVIALPFAHLVVRAIPQTVQRNPTATLILLTCLIFGAMGAVHDMFHQRAFWLFLGGCMALQTPRSLPSPRSLRRTALQTRALIDALPAYSRPRAPEHLAHS